MSHALTLVTYGAGELLEHFFTAIASQHHTASPYRELIRLVTLIAGSWALIQGVAHRQLMATLKWIVLFLLMFYLLFMPTLNLYIVDRTQNNTPRLVSGVPLGLAITASLTSQVGDSLTRIVEPLFSSPKELRYGQTGMLMGSQLMQASRHFTLQDASLRTSLTHFMQQCVFYDLALGRYQIEDLKKTADLWGFLKAKASHARAFVLAADGTSQMSKIVPCFEGVKVLDTKWHQALEQSAAFYGSKWFPRSTHAKEQLLSMLPLGLGHLQQLSTNGSRVLQQILLEHSFNDSMNNLTAKVDAPAASQYAFVKAQQQKRLTNETIGQMAAYWLPLMKNVFEAMLYGAFLLVFLLCLFPFGVSIFKNYIFSLLWVQSWAPLYAIINGVIAFYLSQRAEAQTSVAYISHMQQVHSDMVGLAGYLSMSVPFIAMGLVRSLSSAFTQIATTVTGVTQSTASSSASEAVSGNIALGNLQVGNTSSNNTNQNHYDSSANIQAGHYRSTLAGGSSIGLAPDESITLNTHSASSQLNVSPHVSESIRTSNSEAIEKSEAATLNHAKQYSESVEHAANSVLELGEQKGLSESSGDHFSVSDNTQFSQSYTELNSLVERFARDHNITRALSRRVLLGAYANATVERVLGHKEPKASSWLTGLTTKTEGSLNGGLKADAHSENATLDNKLFQAAQEYVHHSQFSQQMDTALRHAHDSHYEQQAHSNNNLTDNISSSMVKAQHEHDEMMASISKTKALHETDQYVQDKAASIDMDAQQPMVDWLLKQPSPSHPEQTLTPNEIAEMNTHHPEQLAQYTREFEKQYTNDWLKTHQAKATPIEQVGKTWEAQIPGESAVQEQAQMERAHIHEKAAAAGMTGENLINKVPKQQVENQLAENKAALEDKHQTIMQEGQKRSAHVVKRMHQLKKTPWERIADYWHGKNKV